MEPKFWQKAVIKLSYTTASVIHVTKITVVTIIIDHYKYHNR